LYTVLLTGTLTLAGGLTRQIGKWLTGVWSGVGAMTFTTTAQTPVPTALYTVPHEDREYTVPHEDREYTVPHEDRESEVRE
jgi:hypothetical protein